MFYSACGSNHDVEYLLSNTTKIQCIELLDNCPDVNELYNYSLSNTLKNNIDELLYELLSHIINSCSTHLKSNIVGDEISFDVINSNQKEHEFNNLKKDNNTLTLYHDSSISNWHNIIRMGLKNYSGTDKQTNGAAFGSGVYLSDKMNTSLGYCGSAGKKWSKSITLKTHVIMAICELCDKQNENWFKNPHYVVNDEKYINIKKLILL